MKRTCSLCSEGIAPKGNAYVKVLVFTECFVGIQSTSHTLCIIQQYANMGAFMEQTNYQDLKIEIAIHKTAQVHMMTETKQVHKKRAVLTTVVQFLENDSLKAILDMNIFNKS